MPKPIALLITRPEPQASRLAGTLRAEFGDVLEIRVSSLMETGYLTPALPEGPFRTLVLTSEAGAEAATRLMRAGTRLPKDCICVGPRTAAAASVGGFGVKAHFATATALLAHLMEHPSGPYLYLHGQDVTLPLDEMLTKAGQPAKAATAYMQRAVPLRADARAILRDRPVIVPIYSARSARLLLKAVEAEPTANLCICAISEAVAHELPARLAATTEIAKSPDAEGMLSAIRRAIMGLSP